MGNDAGHIVKDTLRLLTVEEIDELVSTRKQFKMTPLTEIILAWLRGEDLDLDKISEDFHGRTEQVDGIKKGEKSGAVGEEQAGRFGPYECADNVAAILAEYNYHCQEAEKKVFAPHVRKKKRSPKMQMANLILEEKKKLEGVNFRLQRQEIIKSYRENSKIKPKRDKDGHGKCSESTDSGILLKKRV